MKRAHRALFPSIVVAIMTSAALTATPPARAEPGAGAHNLQTRFSPTGVTPTAWGMVKYKTVRSFRRLTIETHGLLPGVYDILVGGGVVGSMDVDEGIAGGGGSGLFVLDSRSAGLLIFDPRGTSVEVVNQTSGETELDASHFPANKREEMAKERIALAFQSTDVQPAASGEATFRSFKGRARFVVKVAGLAPGDYDLMIGGSSQAQFHTTTLNDFELTFDTMPHEGTADGSRRLLTFDPRGFPVSISQDGVDLLVIDLHSY